MMRYMIMECYESYAVLLSEDGQFVKAANMHYTTGQTVTDPIIMEDDSSQQADVKGKTVIWKKAATLAACFAFIIATRMSIFLTPYASVYISINPSVRIDVNRSERVMNIEGINTDGERLVQDYNYRNKNLNTVVDELMDRAIIMGYLYGGGQINITLDGDRKWVETHSRQLTRHIKQHVQEKIPVTIQVDDSQQQTGLQVTIPAGDSDYGESDYGDSDYIAPTASPKPSRTDYDDPVSDYSDSDYNSGNSGQDGNTIYGSDSNYSNTDYITSARAESDSGYTDGETDYGTSDYRQDSGYENKSEYDD